MSMDPCIYTVIPLVQTQVWPGFISEDVKQGSAQMNCLSYVSQRQTSMGLQLCDVGNSGLFLLTLAHSALPDPGT